MILSRLPGRRTARWSRRLLSQSRTAAAPLSRLIIIAYHVMSYHVISCHIISCHIISYHARWIITCHPILSYTVSYQTTRIVFCGWKNTFEAHRILFSFGCHLETLPLSFHKYINFCVLYLPLISRRRDKTPLFCQRTGMRGCSGQRWRWSSSLTGEVVGSW